MNTQEDFLKLYQNLSHSNAEVRNNANQAILTFIVPFILCLIKRQAHRLGQLHDL